MKTIVTNTSERKTKKERSSGKNEEWNKKRILRAYRDFLQNCNQITHSYRYKKHEMSEMCKILEQETREELMDGIFISLKGRQTVKSINAQKRTLRRIVEKRHAQLCHRIFGRRDDLLPVYITRRNTGECMNNMFCMYN